MQRRTFDVIVSWSGVVLAGVLLLAAVGLFWGYSFASSNVRDQLSEQRVFFPAKGSEELAPAEVGPYLEKYAGQQLLDGAQAEAYANHYIAVHLKEIAGGKTYAEVSTLSRQNPTDQKLAGQVQTLFRGETLRGLLLTAYGFWKVGQLALIGSIASALLAIVMFVLAALGFRHLAKVPADATVFASKGEPVPSH